MPLHIEDDPTTPGAVLMRIKAVPGAKRDEVAGLLGDRLKVRVAAPPEDGKANAAICALLAAALSLKRGAVEVVRGHTHAEKTVRIVGVTSRLVCDRLAYVT